MNQIGYLRVFIMIVLCLSCKERPIHFSSSLYKEICDHYKDDTSQKQEAVQFLFKYIDNKYSQFDSNTYYSLELLADSLFHKDKRLNKKERLNLIEAVIPKEKGEHMMISDLDNLSACTLVAHIDSTYKNWEKMSAISGATFNDYCEYILPYRVLNEPINEFPCSFIKSEKYCLQDSLFKSDSIPETIRNYIRSQRIRMDNSLGGRLQGLCSARQTYIIGLAPRCDDIAILLVLMLRLQGLPASTDFVDQWGDVANMGHRWLSVKWNGVWYAFDPINGEYLNEKYKKICMAKAFRNTYSNQTGLKQNGIDVTSEYVPVSHVSVARRDFPQRSMPVVAIFNKNSDYRVVGVGKEENKKIIFKDLGRNVNYFVGYYKSGVFTPVLNPVSIDSAGVLNSLEADDNNLQTYVFERKYPLGYRVRNPQKKEWKKTLSGSVIEGSNDGFITKDTLLALNQYDSYKVEEFEVKPSMPYKSVRYVCSQTNMIAELKFLDAEKKVLKGQLFGNYWKKNDVSSMVDNNILTWCKIGGNMKMIYFGYHFENLEDIRYVSVLARNDGNHIVKGNEYELMVWIDGWKSYGCKIATNQQLVFENIPSGALYWLKNLSSGKEELPFRMDKNGNQLWIGN